MKVEFTMKSGRTVVVANIDGMTFRELVNKLTPNSQMICFNEAAVNVHEIESMREVE